MIAWLAFVLGLLALLVGPQAVLLYWLLPFLTFQADCPYLVGSYAEIGTRIRGFAEQGLTTVMLDMVADEAEMSHVCKALAASGVF